MTDPAFVIRSMTREELHLALDWADDEGWNPGIFDAETFHATDDQGFLIGMLGEEKVAMIAAVRYEGDFGHVGFFFLKPEHRDKDYAARMWEAAMQRLAGCHLSLECLPSAADGYLRAGFQHGQRHIGFRGKGGGPMPTMQQCEKIVSMPMLSLEELVAYDRAFFPTPRLHFWRHWISTPYSTVLGIRENGRLLAFGAMRPCRQGFKIAPLFADTPALAETLFMVMRAQTREDDHLFIDIPATNPNALELAQRHEMERVFETVRLHRQATPPSSLDRIYGMTALPLG
jgi:GNAT superfamily N-acetyltransferase